VTPGSARAQQGLRVLDEAVRLLDALHVEPAGRAPASGPEAGGSGDDAPHRGGECRVCPVCRGMAALRAANPEAAQRMTRAVADLGAAIADLVVGPEPARATEPGQPGEPGEAGHEPGSQAESGIQWYVTGEPDAPPRLTVQRIDVTE
jgi:hypothetical protein